ncbi:MAG: hypothetical protein WC054_14825 [Candidatus Nanopelagicales bacterium]
MNNNSQVTLEELPVSVGKSSFGAVFGALANAAVSVLAIVADRFRASFARAVTSERGDVPGWVLVTVMTAGLVTGLWMIADDQLTALLSKAINSVSQ